MEECEGLRAQVARLTRERDMATERCIELGQSLAPKVLAAERERDLYKALAERERERCALIADRGAAYCHIKAEEQIGAVVTIMHDAAHLLSECAADIRALPAPSAPRPGRAPARRQGALRCVTSSRSLPCP